jgi:hypothetical protein
MTGHRILQYLPRDEEFLDDVIADDLGYIDDGVTTRV